MMLDATVITSHKISSLLKKMKTVPVLVLVVSEPSGDSYKDTLALPDRFIYKERTNIITSLQHDMILRSITLTSELTTSPIQIL